MKRSMFVVGTALAFILTPGTMPGVARADTGLYMFAVGGGAGPCQQQNNFGYMDGGVAPTLLPAICYGGPNGEHFAFSGHQDLTASDPTLTTTGHVVLWFTNAEGVKVATFKGPVVCAVAGTGPDPFTNQTVGTGTITFVATTATGNGVAVGSNTQPNTISPTPSTLQNHYLTFSVIDGGPPAGTQPAGIYSVDKISPPVDDGSAVDTLTPSCGATDAATEPVNFGNIVTRTQSSTPAVDMSGDWYTIDGATGNLTTTV